MPPPRWRFPANRGTSPPTTAMRSTIVFLGQTYSPDAPRWFDASWAGVERTERVRYTIVHEERLDLEKIAEDAFAVFNAPDECLNERQLRRRGAYRGPSLSVGDIVQVWRDGVLYAESLCVSSGWDIRMTLTELIMSEI